MKIKTHKKFILFFIVILFTINSLTHTSIGLNPDYSGSKTNLKINSISEGYGLTVSIKNEGDNNAKDIVLSIKSSGGLLFIPKKNYKIPHLSSHDSLDIHIKMFGIGLGILTDCPKIKLELNSPNSNTIHEIITSRIFGSYVKILGRFYNDKDSFEGYTLFTPEYSSKTYLIDNTGDIINTWKSNHLQGFAVYLLKNGDMVRSDLPYINPTFIAGGVSGCVEKFNWYGDLIWDFKYSNEKVCLHHDVEILPNGNILMIAWEYKTRLEAIQAGRNPRLIPEGRLWPDHIIEVEPNGSNEGNIVWEWHVWDHLIQDFDTRKNNYGVVEDHPELIDINYIKKGAIRADWNHINSIDYNEEYDQILLSSKNFNEIWVIDHSTTTEEAAGHTGGRYGRGGDILYRWGNPQAYDAGTPEDQKFFGQHDAQWIESGCPGEGNILVFNNGQGRYTGLYSSVDEIKPPVDDYGNYDLIAGFSYGPTEIEWSYKAKNPTTFYSDHLSGAQRLPNGNTIICNGANGIIFEINPEKDIVWKYTNLYPDPSNNNVFTVRRYPQNYPGIIEI